MQYETLLAFYNDLSVLVDAGDDAQAETLIQSRLAELPEDVRGELMTRVYFEALGRRAEEVHAVAVLQEKGLVAIEILEALKKKLEADKILTK
jgi:hypothetical protein